MLSAALAVGAMSFEDLLGQMAALMDADRVNLFEYRSERGTASLTHEWAIDGLKRDRNGLRDIQVAAVEGWDLEAHQRGEPIWVPDTSLLPPGARRDAYAREGVRSSLATPLMAPQGCVGFVGYAWTRPHAPITANEQRLVGLFTNLVVNMQQRKRALSELQASEEKFRFVFNALNIPKSITQLGGKIEVNQAFADLLGYSREEMMGLSWQRVTHPEDIARTEREMQRMLQGGVDAVRFTKRYIRKDGAVVWGDVSSAVKRGDGPDGSVFITAVVDVTERLKAEALLRESEQRFRAIFRNNSSAMAIIERDTTISAVNEHYCRVSGYTEDEVVGMKWTQQIPPEDLERLQQYNQRRLRDPSTVPNEYEFRFIRKDGQVRDCWISVDMLPASGQIICSFLDITERKRQQEALRESEFFFRESQRAGAVGSYKTDFGAGTWASSEVLDEIFGIGPGYERSVAGWLDIVHPEDRARMGAYLEAEVIARQQPFQMEYRIVRRSDGATRWVAGFGNVAFDAEGRILTMIGTIQDITERKQALEEKARLQAQLQQAQKMESVGRLAGGVAHDFNNMLSVILGYTELAMEHVDPLSQAHGDLLEIRAAAQRSAGLTRQLLAFARKQPVAPRPLDLNTAVESTLGMLRRLLGEDVRLQWQPQPGLWPVLLDPTQLDQLLANLCVNARDAIAGVGDLMIATGSTELSAAEGAILGLAPGPYAMLRVADDGCGMDAETQAHIFEPFFTTKAMGAGTGLGLAMVYGIVQQNHGAISVESRVGAGSTFTVYLPKQGALDGGVGEHKCEEVLRGGKSRILVVEDEPAILKLTKLMLEGQGYQVLAAESPKEALRLAEVHGEGLALLLTDVIMPEMNGADLAAQLQARLPGLKCVYMSGYTADVIAHHGVLDKGVDFLPKPFVSKALFAKVREVLDRPA